MIAYRAFWSNFIWKSTQPNQGFIEDLLSQMPYGHQPRQHQKKGKKKLTRDLDIVKLIQHNQRNFINSQVIFNHDERFLLQFQRRNVIDPDSSSDEENIKEHEKYDWKALQQPERKQDKEPLVKKILERIQGKTVDDQTRRILMGIATQHHKTFEQLENIRAFKRKIKRNYIGSKSFIEIEEGKNSHSDNCNPPKQIQSQQTNGKIEGVKLPKIEIPQL